MVTLCRVTWCHNQATRGRLCPACYWWSRRHDWADPEDRTPGAKKNTVERILNRVARIPFNQNGCRDGSVEFPLSSGYCRVSIDLKPTLVTRIVLENKMGVMLGAEDLACHTCDWPQCVAESHLYKGSAKSNAGDMYERGRANQGKRNSKLTVEQVKEIRRLALPRVVTRKALAQQFGVTKSNIDAILARETWKDA